MAKILAGLFSAEPGPRSVRDRLEPEARAKYDRVADLLGPAGTEALASVAQDIWDEATWRADG